MCGSAKLPTVDVPTVNLPTVPTPASNDVLGSDGAIQKTVSDVTTSVGKWLNVADETFKEVMPDYVRSHFSNLDDQTQIFQKFAKMAANGLGINYGQNDGSGGSSEPSPTSIDNPPTAPEAEEDELGSLGRLLMLRRNAGQAKGLRGSVLTGGSGARGQASLRKRMLGS